MSSSRVLAKRIKTLCKTNKIPIKKLLADCEVRKNFIYDLEKMERSPAIDTLIPISRYLNVSIDYLVGLEDINEEKPTTDERAIDEEIDWLIKGYQKLNWNAKTTIIAHIKTELEKLTTTP